MRAELLDSTIGITFTLIDLPIIIYLALEVYSLITARLFFLQKLWYWNKFKKHCVENFGDVFKVRVLLFSVSNTMQKFPDDDIEVYVFLEPLKEIDMLYDGTSSFISYNRKTDVIHDTTLLERYEEAKRKINPGLIKRYNRNKRLDDLL